MDTTEPDGKHQEEISELIPRWLSFSENSYTDLEAIPSLDAELPQPLWYAKQSNSHARVILTGLIPESKDQRGPESAQRLARAQAIKVQHFGVPEILPPQEPSATGEQPPCLAWTVENGRSLRSSVIAEDFQSPRRVLELVRSVAETLAELHRYQHTVAALTPASIWLGPAGIVQLLGLGLADFDATDLRGAGLRYRAPEQLRRGPLSMAERLLAGTVRERADIWALGMIVLELVDRRPRLRCQDPTELLDEIQDSSLTPMAQDVPWELEELLKEMLVIDVEQRTISADRISEQIDGLLMSGHLATNSAKAVARHQPHRPAQFPGLTASASIAPPAEFEAPAAKQHQDWSWRRAVRDIQDHRRALDQGPDLPTWKLWLLPTLALALLGACVWALVHLVQR